MARDRDGEFLQCRACTGLTWRLVDGKRIKCTACGGMGKRRVEDVARTIEPRREKR